MTISVKGVLIIKTVIHLSALTTFAYLYYLIESGYLGADPVKEMIHFLGKTALNFLLLTLLVTPVAKRFKLPLLMRVRRLVGIYSFVWACLHLSAFLWLELNWQFYLFIDEVVKRPYLTLGAAAWTILLLLTVTSLNSIRKKMKQTWFTLHRFVYWAVLFAVTHYYWSVKSGLIEASIYVLICLLLLAQRRIYFKSLLVKYSGKIGK